MIKDATHLSAIHALQRGRYLAELCLDRCYESCHHVLGALRLDFGRPVLRANKYRTGSEHPGKDVAWCWYKHKVKLPIVATTQGKRHLSTNKHSAAASMQEPSDWDVFLTHARLRSPSIRILQWSGCTISLQMAAAGPSSQQFTLSNVVCYPILAQNIVRFFLMKLNAPLTCLHIPLPTYTFS